MTRYIEQMNKPVKQDKSKPRELTKPGSYSAKDLENSKKIPTKEGYK